ncbi:bifunctional proline dehydrogenase/L-glutamate gamma-semialdehyde dehydrogenase PutA [Trinickia violacea]|uniref:Bifunctional protein PutA n=2 Tax=Trinickia violacea TaxID=2571746 RepID=A0A4P8IX06_9BURK|nr:bifunctional proline dehydrogenase/L-glutamate gamma-semialdehyde dehydrogenase PutA [Trinickia violacea]
MQAETTDLSVLRQRIKDASNLPEDVVVGELINAARMDADTLSRVQALASRLAQGVRDTRINAGGVDLLTQEFSLDSREGIALMCLAEAMLRIPDTPTRNQLIRDKIVDADWRAHIGKSPSLFVNATAWGLLVTGKLLKQPDESSLAEALTSVIRKGGESVVRSGVAYAMRLLGKQFVTGQTIEEAIRVAKSREGQGYRYSYDMLGEAALTEEDARAYFESYRHAIEAIGKDAAARGPIEGPGVSVKISGLHPRYELSQRERVIEELYPRLLSLAELAKKYGIGFHLDQEESARFDLTLEMLERLCLEPSLRGWNGIGISLQSYQKRGRFVAEWLIALARSTGRRINTRLVKGAYWDTEIKLAQDSGSEGYPVFTRKVHSDVSYIACAKALIAAPDAIFPQFATHNAFTIAAVHTLAGDGEYEFQCLHGMGESVYDQIVGASKLGRACRVYAPVGPHATLLAYLVRRLLENGANSSFVNQVVDPSVSIAEIVANPMEKAARTQGRMHEGIPSPRNVLPGRINAASLDFASSPQFRKAVDELHGGRINVVKSIVAGEVVPDSETTSLIYSAADSTQVIGSIDTCLPGAIDLALQRANEGCTSWGGTSAESRASILDAVAAKFEEGAAALGALLVTETGATLAEAADEVRSAVNLCRLYAYELTTERRLQTTNPLGVVACITSAATPLMSLVGQVAAALAVGNAVIAKPARCGSLIAYEVVSTFLRAGTPPTAIQLLLGSGETVGRALIVDRRIQAVLYAGCNATAVKLSSQIAALGRAPKLLFAVRSVNAMIVDSSALPEQVIFDATVSAFRSAGQAASSLRILCLQDSTAEKTLKMLKGILSERRTGNPLDVATDIGPVATQEMKVVAEEYLERMRRAGFAVTRGRSTEESENGNYVAPAIIDMGGVENLVSVAQNATGPILHVVRYRTGEFDNLLERLNATGCGVLGLHTRINEVAGKLLSKSTASSVCVNRAMHSAFVGMQPSGGVGAAGTGPMMAGPLTLPALTKQGSGELAPSEGPFAVDHGISSAKYFEFAVERDGGRWEGRREALASEKGFRRKCVDELFALLVTAPNGRTNGVKISGMRDALIQQISTLDPVSLPALTGEENTIEFLPRGRVLCAARQFDAVVFQAMIASAFGNQIVLMPSEAAGKIKRVLGDRCHIADSTSIQELIERESGSGPAVMLLAAGEGAPADLTSACLERRIPVIESGFEEGCDFAALVRERITTVNASAAGGNTQLMVMSEGGL